MELLDLAQKILNRCYAKVEARLILMSKSFHFSQNVHESYRHYIFQLILIHALD